MPKHLTLSLVLLALLIHADATWAAAADAAVKVSEVILRERMQGETAEGLVRQSLGEVRTRLRA